MKVINRHTAETKTETDAKTETDTMTEKQKDDKHR